jgi:hypothetical protein
VNRPVHSSGTIKMKGRKDTNISRIS